MVLFWGCDPETTPWGFTGQFASRLMYFWKDIGIKQVYICPDLNYGAAVHADKWIPVLPNTDAALQLAIAYIWITEGTYKKEYVETHVVGFDKFSDYVMGKEDGIPKTPEWASRKCGVPEWTIKALAREFAAQDAPRSLIISAADIIRGPWSHEPARLEVCLLGMQGLGGPGVHQHQLTYFGMPRMEGTGGHVVLEPGNRRAARTHRARRRSPTGRNRRCPRRLVHTHLLTEEPLKFTGIGAIEGNSRQPVQGDAHSRCRDELAASA